MKAWQHGYDLSILKAVEERFADYNEVVLSPFAQMKKNRIADLVHNKKMDTYSEPPFLCHIPTNIAKNAVHVRAYGDVDLGIRAKGERMIDNPVGDKEMIVKQINTYKENIWMTINTQYKMGNDIAKEMGFKKIGIKVNSFSDIINVYVKEQTDKKVNWFFISPLETYNIRKIGEVPQPMITGIRNKIAGMEDIFTNHYSNYNKKKSWSAVSLRGFDQLPEMIEKPSEMNDKWQKENGKNDYFIQDTPLMKHFSPEVPDILASLETPKIERVRLMKLEPNGGVLDRHTDQTDKELGIKDGQIVRLHIPIFTNENVSFSSWNWNGKEDIRHMGEGEIWYLDIRKPHKATNTGDSSRIHLVIDVVSNEMVRDMLL